MDEFGCGSLARRLWGELNAARIHHRDAENAELDQTRIRPAPMRLDNLHCGAVILASSGVYSLAARPVWVC